MILAGGHFGVNDEYDRLSGIAPVMTYRGKQREYAWRPHTRDVGRALGRQEQAERLVSDLETKIEGIRRSHPEFEGKTFSSSFHFEADAIATLNSTQDYGSQLLGELGLRLTPAVLDADVLLMGFAGDEFRAAATASPSHSSRSTMS